VATSAAQRLERQRQFTPGNICHPKQGEMVRALLTGTYRDIEVLAGRQSGKSFGLVLASLLLALSRPGVNVLYVASTRETVAKMAFLPACDMVDKYCLPARTNKSNRSITFRNGSRVYFIGADSDNTIKRLRGTPNLLCVIIDEAGIYAPDALKAMVETVRPGLRPLAGKLVIAGTPSLAGKQGTWYEITCNEAYQHFRFDYRDNDKVPSHAAVEKLIDDELAAMFPHLPKEQHRLTAYFLREYMAEFVVDLAEKVYQVGDENLIDAIPPGTTIHLTGGDIGVSANDALVTIGWRPNDPCVYVVEEALASGQDSLAFATMVKDVWERRKPIEVTTDAGGLGAKSIKTVKVLFPTINITEAHKPEVAIQVRAVNTLLQTGRLKILRTSRLAQELAGPTWEDGIVGGKINEHGKHSDLVPALRYAVLAAMQYLPAGPSPHGPALPSADPVENAWRQSWVQPVEYGYGANEPDSSYGGPGSEV
jgi:hypothetical protein